MKKWLLISFLAVVLTTFWHGRVFAITFNENFESYLVGNINGHGGWISEEPQLHVEDVNAKTGTKGVQWSGFYQNSAWHDIDFGGNSFDFQYSFYNSSSTPLDDYFGITFYNASSTLLLRIGQNALQYSELISLDTNVESINASDTAPELDVWNTIYLEARDASTSEARIKLNSNAWSEWIGFNSVGEVALMNLYISHWTSGTSVYVDDLIGESTEALNCEDYTNQYACLYEGANLLPTGRCKWNIGNSTCETNTQTCGNFTNCVYCTTENDCTTQNNCKWNRALFSWQIEGCIYDPTLNYSEEWGTTTATSTYAGTEEPSVLRSKLGNKIPFVYFFALIDGVSYLMSDSATTTLQNVSLTIPALSYTASGSTTTVPIISTPISIPIIDQSVIFQILPQNVWDIIKNLISAMILIGLFFNIKGIIKQIVELHT